MASISPAAGATAGGPRPAATATLRVGLVGCGAFARFSMARYRKLPGVTIAAVADIDPAAARRAAGELGAEARSPDGVLVAPDVDLVYIATPPALHFRQARAALEAGRHVLVEKPLATTVADAEALAARAARQGLVCVANLVERYNPLADAVAAVIRSRLLGELVHGLFVNEAADEGLAPGHWFWDRDVSGGIFVEHGVHFFDLVAFWLGAGEVVAAARSVRPRAGAAGDGDARTVEEQVMCTCRYAAADGRHTGILFHFEHGFHQPSRMDRQELRLVFERGELRLFDWVPTHGELRAVLDDAAITAVAALLPAAEIRMVERYAGAARQAVEHIAPRVDDHAVAVRFATGDVIATLCRRNDIGQIFNGARANQRFKMRPASSRSERRRYQNDLDIAHRPVQLGEAQVIADR